MALPINDKWPFLASQRALDIKSAKGNRLFLSDGGEILDAAGGAIVTNIGAGHPEVVEAIREAAANASYAVPTWSTPERERLVERLRTDWLPADLTQIYLGSGGSECIDAAMRLARFHQVAIGQPDRHKIIYQDISYHGATLSTMAISGHASRRRGLEPLLMNMPSVATPYPLRHDQAATNQDAGTYAAQDLEACIAREGAETIAAFIGEPIIGSSGGAIIPPPSYWDLVQEICHKHGVLLIVDEVMTGFGRTGRKFASEHFDIKPDILVAGKGLAGGYAPLGGVFTKSSITDPLSDAGFAPMFYTFGGHPIGCAAADKVLEIMQRDHLVERVETIGAFFHEQLKALEDHPHIAEIRGKGFLWAVEVVEDRDTLTRFASEKMITAKIISAGLDQGIFYYPGGTDIVRDIVCLGPGFTSTQEDITRMTEGLRIAVSKAVSA